MPCRASIPTLAKIFSNCCRRRSARSRSMLYWRRISIPIPRCTGPAARAWHDTETVLSEHTSGVSGSILMPLNSTRALLPRRSWKRIFPEQLLHETKSASGGSRQARRDFGVIVQGATTCSVHPATSHALDALWARIRKSFRRGRRPFAVRSRHQGLP